MDERADPSSGGCLAPTSEMFEIFIVLTWILTLQLDVAVDEPDAMHPRDGFAEFAPYATYEWLVDACVTLWFVDKV